MAYTYKKDDQTDSDKMKKEGSISVSLKVKDDNTSPITNDIRFTPNVNSEVMDPVILFEGEEELPSGKYTSGPQAGQYMYTDETGYVPYYNFEDPQMKVYYIIHSTYDVYDKNKSQKRDSNGNLVFKCRRRSRRRCRSYRRCLLRCKS